VPRFATLEQIEKDLLRGFPPCRLRRLTPRSGRGPAICLAEFDTVDDARRSLDQVDGLRWKVIPGVAEESKQITWTVKARFGREKRGFRSSAPQEKKEGEEEKKENDDGEEKLSETDVILDHLPMVVDKDNIGQIMEGFKFKLLSLRVSKENDKEQVAVVRLYSREDQLKVIKDIDGTRVEDCTLAVTPVQPK